MKDHHDKLYIKSYLSNIVMTNNSGVGIRYWCWAD